MFEDVEHCNVSAELLHLSLCSNTVQQRLQRVICIFFFVHRACAGQANQKVSHVKILVYTFQVLFLMALKLHLDCA